MKKEELFDVIVAGGGPAGVTAAIAAARNGAKTLLIENKGYLGGMATTASIPAFCTFTDGIKPIIRGIGLEILKNLKKISWASPFYDQKSDRIEGLDWVPIDAEALKVVLDNMLIESGCRLLLHTSVIGCENKENKINILKIHNKSGIQSVRAKYFIDCTGDADIAAMAGCPVEYGDEKGMVQGGTLCFKIANFDTKQFMKYVKEVGENGNLTKAVERAKEDGNFPIGEVKVAGISLPAPGMASVNFGHVFGWNPIDGVSLTIAELEARKKLPELMKFIRDYIPGAEESVLCSSGPDIGVRESRRICGKYRMTMCDYEQRRDFPDSIAYYAYPIDFHAANVEDTESMEIWYKKTKYAKGQCYGIPYRCLIPEGIDNLLVAGRSVSCDRAMQASLRVIPACFAMGEAAGTAAAIAVEGEVAFSEVDTGTLRSCLRNQGVYLK